MDPVPRRALVETGSTTPADPAAPTPALPPLLAPGRSGSDTASHGQAQIVFDRLTKRFGSISAVDDLTFSVAPGRVTGFLGPNGAGKTTTLRMLVGLASPTSGTATFGGVPYASLPHPQQVVGCVLEAAFHPGRTGRNHLRVLARTAGVGDDRVDALLARVGLADAGKRPAGGYSLGMRQRLALAGSLLGDPNYLILDEPANGLDPEGIRWLRQFLKEYASSGRTVLVSSHMLNEVQATVDDIVVIGRGRLLRQARMAELDISEGSLRVRAADPQGSARVIAGLGLRVEPSQDEGGPYLRVLNGQPAAVGQALFEAGIAVHELARERYDLEQRFFAMIEASSQQGEIS